MGWARACPASRTWQFRLDQPVDGADPAVGRSRGGVTIKIHLAADARCRPGLSGGDSNREEVATLLPLPMSRPACAFADCEDGTAPGRTWASLTRRPRDSEPSAQARQCQMPRTMIDPGAFAWWSRQGSILRHRHWGWDRALPGGARRCGAVLFFLFSVVRLGCRFLIVPPGADRLLTHRARGLGFTLDQMRDLLDATDRLDATPPPEGDEREELLERVRHFEQAAAERVADLRKQLGRAEEFGHALCERLSEDDHARA